MSTVSMFKRKCDKSIGGCGKNNVDVTSVVTIQNGKLHLCRKCAGNVIRRLLKLTEAYNDNKGSKNKTAVAK